MADLYAAIGTALERAEAEVHAAEAHGVLCGFLCSSANGRDTAWLQHILPNGEAGDLLAAQTQQVLTKLQSYCLEQLNSSDFQFALLLPSDARALSERSQALAQWCEGFSLGLSAGGLSQPRIASLSAESQEFIQDVLRFSELETELQDNEENEAAYMQLLEYMKIGIVTLYEDCHPAQPAGKQPTLQ